MKIISFPTLAIALLLPGCDIPGATDTAPKESIVVPWDEALQILNTGDVVGVYQSHNLWVYFTRRDGTAFESKEPTIDAIFYEINKCSVCADIGVVTE